MKIVICASMSACKKIMEIKKELEDASHKVVIPAGTEGYADGVLSPETCQESVANKIHGDLLRKYFNEIKEADAVLAVNVDKNGIKNYVGGNTFLEIGFAHVLNKKVYLLNNIPDVSYKDEIIAIQPIILNGKISLIE